MPASKKNAAAKLPPGGKNLKQGTLFSFFSKKPPSTPASSSTTAPIAAAPMLVSQPSPALSPAAAALSSARQHQTIQSKRTSTSTASSTAPLTTQVGDRLSVYWPDDQAYYAGTVVKKRLHTNSVQFQYDDGDLEWLDLSTEQVKRLPSNKKRKSVAGAQQGNDDESEEEEQEWDDDDGSVYEEGNNAGNPNDDDDLDEDNWMVTDDEEDDDAPSSKKKKRKVLKKKSVQVTRHSAPVSSPMRPVTASTIATASTAASSFQTPLRQFANTVSPRTNSSHKSSQWRQQQQQQERSSGGGATIVSQSQGTTLTPNKKNKPPMYTKGAVNPKGSHVHNHVSFLQSPKDANGHKLGDHLYNPRTLQVQPRDLEKHSGKMTNAVQQWWDLKAQYFDTVLLFKTGKFYEMFHMDADVGVDVLGFSYMKGHVAHAGFPESAYGSNADKLVRAGYKVARVEQTETVDQLKQRKARTPKGRKKPQVVNREVCSIMTLGTRTFCAIDDPKALLQSEADGEQQGSHGASAPLLAIREILLEDDKSPGDETMMTPNEEVDDSVKPVCEYGVTIIDAVNGTVTVGQFADDVLRSRMYTLLTTFTPSEILLEGPSSSGDSGASPTLRSLIKSYQSTSASNCRVEMIQSVEAFPKSTALQDKHKRLLERSARVHPWDVHECVTELHRRGYFPRGSKKASDGDTSTSRWPKVLQAVVNGDAELCMSSFGAALFYLQRNLIDQEILSMGIVKAYIPPVTAASTQQSQDVHDLVLDIEQQEQDSLLAHPEPATDSTMQSSHPMESVPQYSGAEDQIRHMSLDGTTLHNLEVLTNAVDHKVHGSLWSKINSTKSPHGSRLLRAWLLRPLFRKGDIERRADAVEEMIAGAGAVALNEARSSVLGKIGDLDRLLSRVHSMSGATSSDPEGEDTEAFHPNDRAVLYESATYTKRKVGDFSKLLKGLRLACQIPEMFAELNLPTDGLLFKVVKMQDQGGFFPDMAEELDFFFDNFDCHQAVQGHFEPARGVDRAYDEACETVERVKADLEEYKSAMCDQLSPRHTAKSSWKYINLLPASKDKYLIELPASVQVPDDFVLKAKRGSGHKQVNKYRTPEVAELVKELEIALEIQAVRKAKGLQLVFAKFDTQRHLWAAASQATALLDALGSLAKTANKPGFCRPEILDCTPNQEPTINIVQGRHPCIESSSQSVVDFVPNDLVLGRESQADQARLLLLSGPNMGGKSTLLRQTCLITILAQLGSYVPAESVQLTPIDCIYTRLGASDRILLGQSTFFVELAETAAALRGATRRSLVIMDELGRGTSTFDGTAIAGATVKHLVERNSCLTLFATHYHSLLEDWKGVPHVRLGHMECMVDDTDENDNGSQKSITFLYTLGPGCCPKSFGINVARLASLPQEVLMNAKRVSEEFEQEMNGSERHRTNDDSLKSSLQTAIQSCNFAEVRRLWTEMNA